jgi:hypothetical protein
MTLSNSFAHWMEKVDAHLGAMCGMSSGDLPDYCYHDAWEEGTKPIVAARYALRNAQDL